MEASGVAPEGAPVAGVPAAEASEARAPAPKRRIWPGTLRPKPMADPSFTVMDELARRSGVVGVERLAALFTKREPEAAKTMSKTEVRKLANDVLKIKPDKQI